MACASVRPRACYRARRAGCSLGRLRGAVRELGQTAKPREALNYYPEYPGFERLFRVPIVELTDRTIVQLPAELDAHAAAGDKARLAIELFQSVEQPQSGTIGLRRRAGLSAAELDRLFRGRELRFS